MASGKALRKAVVREVRWWRLHPRSALALALYPTALLLVLAACFAHGVPEQLPIGIADLDRSTLSRSLVRAIDATQAAAIAVRADDATGLERHLLRGEIYAAVVLPRDLERDALAGRQPTVAIYYDNQHMTAGSTTLAGIRAAVAQQGTSLSADLLRQSGANPGAVSLSPVQAVSEVLFNPQRNYTYFLLASLAPVVLQMFAAMGGVVAVGREFRGGTLRAWQRTAGGDVPLALLGKLAPYFGVLLAVALTWLAFQTRVLDVPLRGSAPGMLCGTSLFIAATLGAGAFIAAASGSLTRALALCTLYVSPTFAYSGTAFPVSAMPAAARAYREFLPLSPYLELTVDQTIRGTPLRWSVDSMLQLALMAAVFLGGATYLLWRRTKATA